MCVLLRMKHLFRLCGIVLCLLFFSSGVLAFNQATAKKFLLYSYSAYCYQPFIQNWSCDYCKGDTTGFQTTATSYDEGTNTFAYVGVNTNNQEIIVCFRGTQEESLKNWITNIKILKTNTPFLVNGSFVADGFYDAWEAHRDNIFSATQSLAQQYPDYQIWVRLNM